MPPRRSSTPTGSNTKGQGDGSPATVNIPEQFLHTSSSSEVPKESEPHGATQVAEQTAAGRPRASSSDRMQQKRDEIYAGEGPVKGRLDWTRMSEFRLKVVGLAPQGGVLKDKSSAKASAAPQSMTAVLVGGLPLKSPNVTSLCAQTTLLQVRALISKQIPNVPAYKFCIENGSVMPDQLSLAAYFARYKVLPKPEAKEFNIYIIATTALRAVQASLLSNPPFCLKFIRLLESQGLGNIVGSLESSSFRGKNPSTMVMSELRKLVNMFAQDTFCLADGTPTQESITLGQYLAMMNSTPEFSERVPSVSIYFAKIGQAAVTPVDTSKSKWGPADPDVMAKLGKLDLAFTDRSAQEVHRDKSGFKVEEKLNAGDYAARGNTEPAVYVSKMNEADWDTVMMNSSVFYGWRFDIDSQQIVRAPKAAFKLRTGLNLQKANPKLKADDVLAQNDKTKHVENSEKATQVADSQKPKGVATPVTAESVAEYMEPKPQGIPHWDVTDRAYIEVTSIQHEFQRSMAENHFSMSSFEASGGGSYSGVNVGVQGGASRSTESTGRQSEKTFSKTLIANYRIPRATLYFPAEDLEPTDDFRLAIAKVRRTKSIIDLRQLHASFGHIFCGKVLLGGVLQTSKIITGKETESESTQKSSFKGQVGLNVSVPGGPSAGMKTTHEKQDGSESGTKTTDTSENMAFDATGGNTLLAADPPAWCASVANFNYWRVIERSEMLPLVETIAGMVGYGDARTWFMQAVPKLSKYLVVRDSRAINVRLRSMLRMETLSRSEDVGRKPVPLHTYLGHNPENPPRPVKISMGIGMQSMKDVEKQVQQKDGTLKVELWRVTYQVKNYTGDAIFSPASTQAPVLMSPKTSQSQTRSSSRRTVWRFELPYGDCLAHESLVSIRPLSTDNVKLSLAVYRNGQGIYLPTLTSSPDPVYWRLLKFSPGHTPRAGDPFEADDAIRLCWRFSDQVSGFRDYFQDFYGRRRFSKPVETRSNSLFLKAPYPRFENIGDEDGNELSLMMSAIDTTDSAIEKLCLLSKEFSSGVEFVNYTVLDIPFRLDSVGNDGDGEINDYMNIDAEDHVEFEKEETLSKEQVHFKPRGPDPVDTAGKVGQTVGSLVGGPLGGILGRSVGRDMAEVAQIVEHGSALDIAEKVFSTAMGYNPIVAGAKWLLG